jgi:hypothetical protein
MAIQMPDRPAFGCILYDYIPGDIMTKSPKMYPLILSSFDVCSSKYRRNSNFEWVKKVRLLNGPVIKKQAIKRYILNNQLNW